MFIRQIINNNVVLVRDTGGKELIVVAKGIGYHGRTGAAVDLKRYPDHRLFVPDDAEHARIRQIYNEIPEDQFDLAVQLLQMEQQARGMDGSIPITAALMLADHLHEMVARLKNGLELHNALTNEITALCLTEFAAQGYSILFGYWWTACISVIGIALGALLVARDKEERSLALSCSLVAIFGGVSEPTLFSYLLRNKRYAIPMAIGGALGGGLAGLLGTKATSFCMATIFTVPLVEMGGSFVTSAIVFLAEIAAGMIATVLFVGKKQKAAV